jgi:hypothetical protein
VLPNPNLPSPKNIEEYFQALSLLLPKNFPTRNGVEAKDLILSLKPLNVNPKDLKKYKCYVYCSSEIQIHHLENLKTVSQLHIFQRTPTRVAH